MVAAMGYQVLSQWSNQLLPLSTIWPEATLPLREWLVPHSQHLKRWYSSHEKSNQKGLILALLISWGSTSGAVLWFLYVLMVSSSLMENHPENYSGYMQLHVPHNQSVPTTWYNTILLRIILHNSSWSHKTLKKSTHNQYRISQLTSPQIR